MNAKELYKSFFGQQRVMGYKAPHANQPIPRKKHWNTKGITFRFNVNNSYPVPVFGGRP
jgi:hypothetical protein